MYITQFRHRVHLSKQQIVVTLICLFLTFQLWAQDERMNNPEHEKKPYYFGIAVGFNSAQYKVFHSKYFIENDSVANITPLWKPGFQLGILGNLRLSGFVDLRMIPSFMLREKAMRFNLQGDSVLTNSFESVLFSLPLEFKFKSDRQTNFRFYVCAGGKLDYDFNANAKSKRNDDVLKIKSFDYGYNLGLGFEFYFPNFIFSPEIKVSNGLGNSLLQNAGEPTNKAIDRITTRMILVSFVIEG